VKHRPSQRSAGPLNASDSADIALQARQLVEAQIARFVEAPPRLESSLPPEFPERIETFVRALVQWGSRMNLTAQPTDAAEIAFHIVDSLMPLLLLARILPPTERLLRDGQRLLDFGSGAGFPGLVLAVALPGSEFTLVEARRKRSSFLRTAIGETHLSNAHVEAGRFSSESVGPRFDAVTGRASGPLGDFLETAGAALKGDGLAILYANQSQTIEIDSAEGSKLRMFRRVPYELERAGKPVKRLLAILQRT
jgi:16S rRNA (guanine527-N7)-methyltransferase